MSEITIRGGYQEIDSTSGTLAAQQGSCLARRLETAGEFTARPSTRSVNRLPAGQQLGSPGEAVSQ
jgi:hypothetical protein